MNELMLLGRISKDIFVKDNFAILTLAVTKKHDKTKTDFIPVLVSGPQLEDVTSNLFKGDKVFIKGHVTVFTNKDGKSVVGLNADSVEYISPGVIHRQLEAEGKLSKQHD